MNNRTAKALRRRIKQDIKQFTPWVPGITKYAQTGTHGKFDGFDKNGLPQYRTVSDPVKMVDCLRLFVKNAKTNYKNVATKGPASTGARISAATAG